MTSRKSTSAALAAVMAMGAMLGAALPMNSLAATATPSRTESASIRNDTLSRRDWRQIQSLMTPAPLIFQQAYLKASNPGMLNIFGDSIAISGNTLVVGASLQGSDSSGAAYVFTRSGSVWSQQAFLKASNPGPFDNFGYSVGISGDTLVVGAIGEDGPDDGSANNSGAVYVFERSGTTWTQESLFKGSNTAAFDNFGTSVAIDGGTIVVGAPLEDGPDVTQDDDYGAAYVFTHSGTTWPQQAYLQPLPLGAADDEFGQSVAISGNTVVVGAPFRDGSVVGGPGDVAPVDSGSAYVFTRTGTIWSQQANLKASNLDAGDQFGTSVAVSADTLVVGAIDEDSNLTGVNQGPANESAPEAGAAYVFIRSGPNWNQQAYLKASNTGAGDEFGKAVAISGDLVVVGAYPEDSSVTGVNGGPDNDLAGDSGAAYVFSRSGTTWSQHAYLKASNTDSGDQFAKSVAISGDTLVAGANGEASNATGVNGDQTDNSVHSAGAAYVFRQPLACAIGYYSTTGDDTFGPCTAASVGYYVDTTGATVQTPCPHGTTTTATASDSASDCVPLSAYAKKQGASASLRALIPTGWGPSDELLTKATFRIDRSLDSWRWLDANTLNPLHGYRVFNSERKAVRFLTSPLFYGNATVSTALTDLVSADRAVVANQISLSSDPAAQAIANQKLALADSRIAAGQYGPAIKALKQAWLAVA